jgi:hypothetical protein
MVASQDAQGGEVTGGIAALYAQVRPRANRDDDVCYGDPRHGIPVRKR